MWLGLLCDIIEGSNSFHHSPSLSTTALVLMLFPVPVATVSVDHPFPVQDRGPHHVALHIRSKPGQRLPTDACWNFISPNCSSQTRRKLPKKQSKSVSLLGILLPKNNWRCVTREGGMNTCQFSNDWGCGHHVLKLPSKESRRSFCQLYYYWVGLTKAKVKVIRTLLLPVFA